MSTENENRLHEIVNMQNVDIPLSLLFDLTDFAKDKIEDININIDLLKTTLDSSYIDRQSSIVKNAIQTGINEAEFELCHWEKLYRYFSILSDSVCKR